MENVIFDGLIIIQDSEDVSGLPMWCSYLLKSLNLNFNVDLALFLYLQKNLPKKISQNSCVRIKEFFDEDFDKSLLKWLNSTVRGEKNVLFFDSVNMLINKIGVSQTAALFFSWLENGLFSAIVCRVNSSALESINLKKLSSCATTTFSLSIEVSRKCNTTSLICHSAKRKNGLLTEKWEEFVINEIDFTIKSTAFNKFGTQTVTELLDNESNILTKTVFTTLPFDVGLNLKETERQAKTNIQLPYLNAQNEKGLVGLNISSRKRIRVGGQIVYVPDKDDDLDDSDPDDDLMI